MATDSNPETLTPEPARDADSLLLDHWRGSYLLALRITGNSHAAEDVVQDAFLNALIKARRNPPRDARTWLLRITANQARKWHRSKLSRQRLEARVNQSEAKGEEKMDEATLAVRSQLEELDEKYRIPVSLHYEQGLTFNQVATVVGVPEGTAATLISRGLERLRLGLARKGYALAPALLVSQLEKLGSTASARPEFLPALKAMLAAKAMAPATISAGKTASVLTKGGLLMKISLGIAVVALAAGAVTLAGRGKTADSIGDKTPMKGGVGVATNSPLVGLPSAPGPHIEKIKSLGDNQWLDLGSPAPDPKWGKARGRDYSPRMVYAPDLKAAFLMGEGIHCWWNKDNNRYEDDLFVYDTYGHRWVCAYPGTDVNNVDLKLDANGFEVDKEGRPTPISQLVHGYEQLTYDSDLKRFMFMPCSTTYWQDMAPFSAKRKAWGVSGQGMAPAHSSPWTYDTQTGCWDIKKVSGAVPNRGNSPYGDVLIYVPSIKKLFFYVGCQYESWLYDPAANSWSKLAPKGTPVNIPGFGPSMTPFSTAGLACLDTKRDRIYIACGTAFGSNVFWCYDIKSNTWMDLKATGNACQAQISSHTALMNYDSANDAVVLFLNFNSNPNGNNDEQFRGVYVYDPTSNSWADKALTVPKEFHKVPNAFYSPDLNAHFIHCAANSADDGTMLVYRYKKEKK